MAQIRPSMRRLPGISRRSHLELVGITAKIPSQRINEVSTIPKVIDGVIVSKRIYDDNRTQQNESKEKKECDTVVSSFYYLLK